MVETGSTSFILVPPKTARPYWRYPSLGLPHEEHYLINLLLLPIFLFGLWQGVHGFLETQDEIARSAYVTATFSNAARRPGVCRYTLEFPLENEQIHSTLHLENPGKRGCSWSAGEKVQIRYVRDNPDRIKLLEPSGDWTVKQAVLFGLFLGSFTFIPAIIFSTIFTIKSMRRFLLRIVGRPLIGELIKLEVTPHYSSVRIRGDGMNLARRWVSAYTLDVSYRVRTEDGRVMEGRHTLHRGEGEFTAPPPGTPLLIMYARPRLHRAL